MKIRESVIYKGYEIERTSKVDYITTIAHDSVKDAKDWIDRLIAIDELKEVEDATAESSKEGT